jgi:hypothetical protein
LRTVAYFRQQARDCREIAKQISLKDQRDMLQRMAMEWEGLARDREAELAHRASTLPASEDGPERRTSSQNGSDAG